MTPFLPRSPYRTTAEESLYTEMLSIKSGFIVFNVSCFTSLSSMNTSAF